MKIADTKIIQIIVAISMIRHKIMEMGNDVDTITIVELKILVEACDSIGIFLTSELRESGMALKDMERYVREELGKAFNHV